MPAPVLIIIQARYGSTRLPGKILMDLAGKAQVLRVAERADAAKTPHRLVIATTTNPEDDATAKLCADAGLDVYRGSALDVLDRCYQAALPHNPEIVVRVTADCPLLVPEGIDEVVSALQDKQLDYCCWDLSTVPLGLAAEAVTWRALDHARREGTSPADREHVTWHIHTQPDKFRVLKMRTALCPNRPDLRLTVDTPEDFQLMRHVYEALHRPGTLISIKDAVRWLDEHPEVKQLNSHVQQKSV